MCIDRAYMGFPHQFTLHLLKVVSRPNMLLEACDCVSTLIADVLLFISSLTASFLLENGTKTKPESEAPQRQEEPLVSQGPLKTRP